MAKQTNRAAWGLVVTLATALVGSVGGLAAYGRQTRTFTIRVKPFQDRPYWTVGRTTIAWAGCSRLGSIGTLAGFDYSLGFLEVEVPYRGPEVNLWNTYRKGPARSGAGR